MMAVLVGAMIVCACLGFGRFVIGPSDSDRIVAIEILFAAAIGLCCFAALFTGRVLFLDVAVGLVLVSFVATLAWSRLLEKGGDEDREGQS